MTETEPFRIDDSRMPVLLGSALKVPSYAYPLWGIISHGAYRQESEDLYAVEWEGGSPRQVEYVIEAITRTGLGNFSNMLREKNAEVISHLVQQTSERVNYLEPGAGVSTLFVYKKLLEDGVDLGRVFGTLTEPSVERLESAIAKLEEMGLKRGKNFVGYGGKKDTDSLVLVGPESQDIVGTGAQIHHHSYLDVPFVTLAEVLKPKGYLVCSDWHNSMWEHPNRVYEYLMREFDWGTKDADLAAFSRMYPLALSPAPTLDGPDEKANADIRKFWRQGWAEVRGDAIANGEFDPRDDILMLEAHRPVRRYKEVAAQAGLSLCTDDLLAIPDDILPENPHPLVEGSSILQTLALQKGG